MREISISQLKRQTFEVVRAVREGQAEYVITRQGKPVAKIVRFTSPAEKQLRKLGAFWDELDQLAQEWEESAPPAPRAHCSSYSMTVRRECGAC
jgi:prevent-host-death family protein